MEPEQKTLQESAELYIYKDIVSFAEKQINRAWKAYATLLPLLALIITVGLFLLYFQYGNSIKSIEKSIQDRTEIVEAQVAEQIAFELRTPKIHEMIATSAINAAKEQINAPKVQNMIDVEVQRFVDNELQNLRNDISLLRSENEKARDEIQLTFDLLITSNKAEYDLSYLYQLKTFSEHENPKISSFSKSKLTEVIDSIKLDHSRITGDYFGQQWKYFSDGYFGITSSKDWKIDDYINGYNKIPKDQTSVYIVGVFELKKITQSEKYKFSKYILKNSSQPLCIYIVCDYINKIAKIDKDYLFEYSNYIDWIEKNI